jgi:hypothetical protein
MSAVYGTPDDLIYEKIRQETDIETGQKHIYGGLMERLRFWIRKILHGKSWRCRCFCPTCPHFHLCRHEKDMQ